MKDLTIVIADTFNHVLAKHALDETVRQTGADNIVAMSDKPIHAKHVAINPIQKSDDYSLLMLKGVNEHVHTSHALVVQYDGYVANKNSWTDEFLEYDYIGAPWTGMWGPKFDVGNGGFSLRSKRLLEALQDPYIKQLPIPHGGSEDVVICFLFRGYLEREHGIKFAPRVLAEQFSIEFGNRTPVPFGFHSAWQIPLIFGDNALEFFIQNLSSGSLLSVSQKGLFLSLAGSGQHRMAEMLFKRYEEAGENAIMALESDLREKGDIAKPALDFFYSMEAA